MFIPPMNQIHGYDREAAIVTIEKEKLESGRYFSFSSSDFGIPHRRPKKKAVNILRKWVEVFWNGR